MKVYGKHPFKNEKCSRFEDGLLFVVVIFITVVCHWM
jgi:hypothetical protein